MKWPWVSRLAYETLERSHETVLRLLHEAHQAHQELVGDVVTMKRDGFVAAPQSLPDEPQVKMADEVTDALDTLQLQGSVRYQMAGWAQRQIDKGRKPDEVARELLAGGSL